MNDLAISTIRTFVPTVVGSFVLFLANYGITIDTVAASGLTAFAIGLATAVYYLGVRLLATKYPWLEGLLGVAKKPEYKEAK